MVMFQTDIVQISHTNENVLTISLRVRPKETSASQSVHLGVKVYSFFNELH